VPFECSLTIEHYRAIEKLPKLKKWILPKPKTNAAHLKSLLFHSCWYSSSVSEGCCSF